MSDYSQITNFTTKDGLTTGDPEKIISGADFDAELSAISTAIATKFDTTDVASQAQAEAETANTVLMTPLRVANWADANGGMVGDIQALADPNADRILFWDDGAGAAALLTATNGLEISATSLQMASTAGGAGLTYTSGVLAVGAGSGITVNANDVAITNVTAGTTQPINISSGTFSFRIDQLASSLTGATIAGADLFIVDDGAGGTNKKIAYQDFGIPVVDDATTTPFSAADLTYANKWYSCSNASAITATIPANASIAYPVGTTFWFYQVGAGQVTVAVTTDTLRAPNGTKTAAQYSVVSVTKVASTTWVLTGDATV